MTGVLNFPDAEGERVSVGGPVDEARPTLCVYSNDLNPADISNLLGCAPTSSHLKGDELVPGGARALTGAWFLEASLVLPRFDAHPDKLAVLPAGGVWWASSDDGSRVSTRSKPYDWRSRVASPRKTSPRI